MEDAVKYTLRGLYLDTIAINNLEDNRFYILSILLYITLYEKNNLIT